MRGGPGSLTQSRSVAAAMGLAFVVLATACGDTGPVPVANLLHVLGSDTLTTFTIDSSSGHLTVADKQSAPGARFVAVAPRGDRLFAVAPRYIRSYSVSTDGRLTLISELPSSLADYSPVSLVADDTRVFGMWARSAFSRTYYTLLSYAVGSDGSLSDRKVTEFGTDFQSGAPVAIDTAHGILYQQRGYERIGAYVIESGGQLRALGESAKPGIWWERLLAMEARDNLVFVAGEGYAEDDSEFGLCSVARTDGAPEYRTCQQGLWSQLAVSASGWLAVGRTQGSTAPKLPSVSLYSWGKAGELTLRDTLPVSVVSNASSLAFDPSGHFLYVSDSSSKRLHTLAVDPAGRLSLVESTTEAVGSIAVAKGR
jgi:hypothetical protein